jgi:anthranilate phosphoribosyltransferase
VQELLKKLAARQDLTAGEAEAAMDLIMSGEATPAQIGAFLAALRSKGETVDEIAGCARAMRAKATRVPTRRDLLVDIVGTGGDGAGTFNISTTTALVVAGGGLAVAKHGNRAMSSRSGSADVLEALGVRIDLDAEALGRCLDEVGIAFLFAQRLHGAMKHAAGPRRELGFRTVFNLLGPLTNPAFAQVEVIGVPDPGLVEPMARVLQALGLRRAIAVHGEDGSDEITVTGPTRIADAHDGSVETYAIAPEDVGLARGRAEDLRGGSPAENAAITRSILEGERGPRRDVVLLNAAAGFVAAGAAADYRSGVRLAAEVIDSGRALAKLRQLVDFTQAAGEAAAG